MSVQHWLAWLAFCLAGLWLGQTLKPLLPESRMHKGARTDPCGGREATRGPTATRNGP